MPPHVARPLTPEKEGFIGISGPVSRVFTPQSNVTFRLFTKTLVFLLNFLALVQFVFLTVGMFGRLLNPPSVVLLWGVLVSAAFSQRQKRT